MNTQSPASWSELPAYQGSSKQDYQCYLERMQRSIAERMASFEQIASQVAADLAEQESKQQEAASAQSETAEPEGIRPVARTARPIRSVLRSQAPL